MEIPATLHTFFPVPVSRSQVTVVQKSLFDRRRGPDELEQRGDQVWKRRVADNAHLFNGTKFRFAGVTVTSGELVTIPEYNMKLVTPAAEARITLNTGFSCYKDHIATNMSGLAEEFSKHGLEQYDDNQACLGDIMGHSALLISADGCLVIQLRSQTVGEGPGMWHFPGGHPEPEDIGVKTTADMEKTDPVKIVDELFDSLLREMKEELNLSPDVLSDPLLLSIIKDQHCYFKPEFNFILRSTLTAQQISEKYHAEDFEEDESDDIGFWSVADLDITNRMSFELLQYKEEDGSMVEVSTEQLAGTSRQLLRCLKCVREFNPTLLVF